jgi:hypothetical protein
VKRIVVIVGIHETWQIKMIVPHIGYRLQSQSPAVGANDESPDRSAGADKREGAGREARPSGMIGMPTSSGHSLGNSRAAVWDWVPGIRGTTLGMTGVCEGGLGETDAVYFGAFGSLAKPLTYGWVGAGVSWEAMGCPAGM